MSNSELKIVYDSEGRAIVDKEVLDLLLKEHDELVAKRAEVFDLKEDLDAMTTYAEMFERGEIGVPGATGSTIVADKLTQLYAKLEMYEKEPKKSYVEQIMELQEEVKRLRQRLHWIWAIGVDYDGYKGSAEDLEDLIDEMVEFTQMTDEEVAGQSKTVEQMQQLLIDAQVQNQQLFNHIQKLEKPDNSCEQVIKNVAAKVYELEEYYDKGSADAAAKILHYIYPFWQDTTSKEVAIGRTIEWIKATFGV